MRENKTIIDKDGFVVERNVVFIDGDPQGHDLKEGEIVVNLIIEDCHKAFIKPQFVDGIWKETATQEELNETYPVTEVLPAQEEILRAKLIKDNADVQLQLAQQQKLNADILLKLANVGGIANV